MPAPDSTDDRSRLPGLEALHREAAALAAQADTLLRDVEQEAQGAQGDNAPWHALAERVLPLSLKDAAPSPRQRYLSGLIRRRVRLEREGRWLRARSRELLTQARQARTRQTDPAGACAWAAAVAEHQRLVGAWADQVVEGHRRQSQRRRPAAEPD